MTCSQCGHRHYSRGLCYRHYAQHKRAGTLPPPKKTGCPKGWKRKPGDDLPKDRRRKLLGEARDVTIYGVPKRVTDARGYRLTVYAVGMFDDEPCYLADMAGVREWTPVSGLEVVR